jgi:hypothetical protein
MNKVRIVGAIASANGITFFLENGQEMNLQKDSSRTKAILDETVQALARHEVVEIDLDNYSVERQIEKKTGGLIRFVKSTMSKLFGGSAQPEVETVVLGVVEKASKPAQAPAPVLVKEPEVAAAIVKTPKGDVVIPNIDRLERHMEHAASTGNVIGVQRFMERIASVIDQRKHSVDELLNFMKRGDLPIADDGSIVAYKVLTTERAPAGKFVDCHSHNVVQQLGSHVSMPVDRVDDSRRTQCSTGLHIARRGYLRNFGGDVITIVKVAPEDVIAVPHNEPDKMRAAAYHIVAVLPQNVHATLRANRPMTGDSQAAKILADVIAGNHVGIIERVSIGAAMGEKLTIEPTNTPQKEVVSLNKTATALDDAKTSVNISEVKSKIVEALASKPAAEPVAPVKVPPVVGAYVPLPTTNELKAGAKPVKTPTTPQAPSNDDKPKKAAAKATAVVTKKEPVKRGKAETVTVAVELPANHVKALELRKLGKSNRAIEAELHICRKTLKKLFDQHG